MSHPAYKPPPALCAKAKVAKGGAYLRDTTVYWDENSDEPVGWDYAVVKKHLSDGATNIEYANKDTETVNLHSVNTVKWKSTKKGQNRIFLATQNHPSFHLIREEIARPKFNSSSLSAKSFADDLHLKITNPSC